MNKENAPSQETDSPGVRVPPPLIFLGFLVLGLVFDSDFGLSWNTLVGGLIAVLGLTMILKSVPKHKEAGSNVEPWEPTHAIISTGLYGRTRNPIYLGMALTHGGIAIAAVSLGALISLALALIVIQTYVIAREERYLTKKFGEEYLSYKSKVRRWI